MLIFFLAPDVPFTVIVEVFKYDCANIGVSVSVCACVRAWHMCLSMLVEHVL